MDTAQNGLFEVYNLWYYPWWHGWKLYIFFAFLLLIIALYFIWRRYYVGVKLTSEQEALQQLHRLRSQVYSSQDALHDAYFRLTRIAKNYLSARYQVILHDKSDTEIVLLLHGNLQENMINLLQEFFDRAFRIKFAYDAVSEIMLFEDIAFLQSMVTETSKSAEITGKF